MSDNFFSNISFDNKLPPRPGKILISDPFLCDAYFKRSVVLLVEHGDKGSIGFILNRPVNINLSDAVEGFPDSDAELFFGGPVEQDSLFFLHTLGEDTLDGSIMIMPDLFWGGNFEKLKIMYDTGQINEGQVRFFAGYSGWSSGQLREELQNKAWVVADSGSTQIMHATNQNFWNKTMSKLGKKFAIMANFPEDPSLN